MLTPTTKIFASVATASAIGVSAWLLFAQSAVPEWKLRMLEQPLFEVPENPNPRSTKENLATWAYLRNDLCRRDDWGAREVEEVLTILRASPLDMVPVEGVTTDRDWGLHSLSWETQGAIRTRIGIGAPIDPAQRTRLIDALLERSHAADYQLRLGLAEAFCWSGLIFEDERVDKRVHEMMNDPEPRVAANARNQYQFHSEGRAKRAEYQRRQGRDIPFDGG